MGIENCFEVYLNSKEICQTANFKHMKALYFVLWRLRWPAAGQRSCMVLDQCRGRVERSDGFSVNGCCQVLSARVDTCLFFPFVL